MKHRIDMMSKKILQQIGIDAGYDVQKIADAVGCNPAVVEDRVAKLLEDGVVKHFRANIDLSILSTFHEALVVGVPTHETDPAALRRLAKEEDVTRVFTMAAQASIAFHVRGTDPNKLEARAAELAQAAGLAAHRTTLVVADVDSDAPAVTEALTV